MALKADLCSAVMHAQLQHGKASGRFIHSAGSVQILSNLSFKNNNDHAWMTTLRSLISLRNQKRNSDNKFRVLSMSSVEQAATKAAKVPVEPPELEYDSDPPMNLYPSSDPDIATVDSVRKITGPTAPGEVFHIVIDHKGKVPFWEGQYYGVAKPHDDPRRTGSAAQVRFFSLASTRYGDLYNGQTASLCVLRSGPKTSVSNYLCDCKPGDEVLISGPSGRTLLFPQDPQATPIMVATSTGVAPFRGHLRRMFIEAIPNFEFTGKAWLIAGADNSDSLLYDDEFTNILNDHPANFRYDKALRSGEKTVADKIEENGDEIWERLDEGAHIYFSGSKTMMPGILDTFESLANKRGVNWDQKLSKLRDNGQWRIEVY